MIGIGCRLYSESSSENTLKWTIAASLRADCEYKPAKAGW